MPDGTAGRTRVRSLLRTPDEGAAARIFCFPYSGVGASMFNRWPRWVGAAGDVEVCPIQLAGRENRIRDPHFGTYQALAEEVVADLGPLLDRPAVLFGHCAGALPAFEVARRLPGPVSLVVSGQVAPHDCPHDRFLDCTDDELLAELAMLTGSRGGEVDQAWLDFALAVLHKDLDANRVYWLDQPVRTELDLTVLHWSADPEVSAQQLTGWAQYGPDVRFEVLDGGHHEFLSAPPALLDLLLRRLGREP